MDKVKINEITDFVTFYKEIFSQKNVPKWIK